jgi:hypothetical protein
MELALEPDMYSPSVDNLGKYIDNVPSFSLHKGGLLCPCGSRKDKYYKTHNTFLQHTKTKIHQKWLNDLNLNKSNYYIENITIKETLHNQQLRFLIRRALLCHGEKCE